MRFEIEQRFDAPPDAVLRAYTDPALYDRMVGLARVEAPTVLGTDREGDQIVVRVRYRFIADLPGAATAVVDPARLTWVDESRYDLAARTSTTQLLPDHYADRLRASASASYEPDGAGTRRRIAGELTVRAPLVGGRVERAIVDGLREHLADEARVVGEHLAAD